MEFPNKRVPTRKTPHCFDLISTSSPLVELAIVVGPSREPEGCKVVLYNDERI